MVTDPLAVVRDLVGSGSTGLLITPLDGGPAGVIGSDLSLLCGPEPDVAVAAAAESVLDSGVPRVIESDRGSWFVEPVRPAPRLVVFGAIAVADSLVPMAAAAGFSVVVVDPRPWLATPDRHPAAMDVRCGVPIEVMEGITVDSGTAVVSFLHEPRLEDPVLMAALSGPAGYVGAMGSGRTTAAKRERLAAAGLTPGQIGRLHAPIGLDIGSVSPNEIAVSVLAEIVAVRRGAS